MNNQDIKVNLTDGGYNFPVKILEENEALNLNTYYQETNNKTISKNLIFEHNFKAHLIFKKINKLINNKKILAIA